MMNTLRPTSAVLSTAATLVLAGATLLCQSCALPSVYAVAPKAPPVKIDWAEGVWTLVPERGTNPPPHDFTATIQPIGGERFTIDWKSTSGAVTKDMTPLKMVARPFELGGRLFADLMIEYNAIREVSKKYPAFFVPTHVLARIDRDAATNTVTLSLPVFSAAQEIAVKQHVTLPMVMSESDSDVPLALTSGSETLTKFYEANAANDELFSLKLKFAKATPASAPATHPAAKPTQ